MTIDKINRNGNVTFKFNQDLIVPFDEKRSLAQEINLTAIMKITFDSEYSEPE